MWLNNSTTGFDYATVLLNLTNKTKTRLRSGGCFRKDVIFHTMAYVIIILVSLVGNSMTVYIITKGRLVRKNPHLFLLNMAVADLLITVVYMPRMILMMLYGSEWLVRGTLGLALCRFVPFLHHISILASVMTILGVTVDRFCAIMYPLKRVITLKTARKMVVMTWLLAALLRTPYLITPTINLRKYGAFVCDTNLKALFGVYKNVYTKSLLSLYCALLLLTCILYVILIVKLHKTKVDNASTDSDARKRAASRKLLHMLSVVTVCFILCWFVYFFAFDIFKRPLSCSIRFVRFFLAHSNSAINPIVLAVFNDRYRHGYKKVLSKCFPRT